MQAVPRGCGYDVFPSFMMAAWNLERRKSDGYLRFYAWQMGYELTALGIDPSGVRDYVSKSGIYGAVYYACTNPNVWRQALDWVFRELKVPSALVRQVSDELARGEEGTLAQADMDLLLGEGLSTDGCNFEEGTRFGED